MALRVFGLTGGIGSGKSTAAEMLRGHGVPIVNADELAREAVAKGSPGLDQVVAAFGADVLSPAGELERKRLAALVFSDPEARKRLNAITHPIVRQLSQERFAELDRQGCALAGYDVPLLFEVGLDAVLKPVVVVAASEATQLARIAARGDIEADDAKARIRAQLPLAEKARRADYVLANDGTLSELAAQVAELVTKLRARTEI
jgi:dephospho-CoA kinase